MARGEIADNKTPDGQAFCQYRAHHRRSPFRHLPLGVVILRDQAAYGNARERVEQRKYRLKHRAADILEIDIDALWAGVLQFCRQIGIAMIEAVIEAELAFEVFTFFLAACYSYGKDSLDLCIL